MLFNHGSPASFSSLIPSSLPTLVWNPSVKMGRPGRSTLNCSGSALPHKNLPKNLSLYTRANPSIDNPVELTRAKFFLNLLRAVTHLLSLDLSEIIVMSIVP
uniref:Uncharacterized protein n=1 Tax=Rhizophora mucronata TaxID=61149 RepID=A0A2P2Q820_RHIMU